MELSKQKMELFLILPGLWSKNFFYIMFVIFTCFHIFSTFFNFFQLFSTIFNYFQLFSSILTYLDLHESFAAYSIVMLVLVKSFSMFLKLSLKFFGQVLVVQWWNSWLDSIWSKWMDGWLFQLFWPSPNLQSQSN